MKRLELGDSAGPPVVILPGNDLGAPFYAPLGKVIAAAGHTVRLLTLPGYHGEPALAVPSWAAMVDAVEAEVPPGAVLVGHSLGGLLALLVAARVDVDRLVLLEPAVPPGRRAAAYSAKRYLADVVTASRDEFENWSGSFYRIAEPSRFPAWAIEHYQEVRRTSDVATARALVEAMPNLYPLPPIDKDVHVLRGGRSGWFARINAMYLKMKLPNARVSVVPNVGHWMANEDDERLARLILA